jgi:UDP-2,3-diacylglucosamine hydrolase
MQPPVKTDVEPPAPLPSPFAPPSSPFPLLPSPLGPTASDLSTAPAPRRVGLLAGWGRYPVLVAEALRRQGYEVYCLGVAGHADPHLAELCHVFGWTGLGRFGYAIRYFKHHGVTDAMMAGKIHKTLLFQPWRCLRHLPDLRTIRMFIPHFLTRRKDCRDDTLLGAICNEFASEGIRFGPATDYAPDLLVGRGQLTRRAPTAAQGKDIRFGWQMAKEMGRLDIGQSVAVKDQTVLAVEAVEGTDECIRRAGTLCRQGGFTVVKVAKPQQDMRFDVPTIGLGTIKTLAEAGARVLAVEAGRTILLDGPEVIDEADRQGIAVVAIDAEAG